MSPDPYDGSYDATNPQSLNRYSYVLNNPLSLFDPLGLTDCNHGEPCSVPTSPTSGDPTSGPTPTGPGENGPGSSGGGGGKPKPPKKKPITCYDLAMGNVPNYTLDQWANGFFNAASMFDLWAQGLGNSSTDFGPDTPESQLMLSAYGLANNVAGFLLGGDSKGFQQFGASGFFSTGLNPTAQFVGSYGWNMSLTNGNLNITLTNSTTRFSFFYHAPIFDPNPPIRSGYSPTGRVDQIFHLVVPCT
jgi:hypothetical protein